MQGTRAAPSTRPSSRLGARSPVASPSSFSTLRAMAGSPSADTTTLRPHRTLQPKRSLRDLYASSTAMQTAIGGTPFSHVEAASRRSSTAASTILGSSPPGPMARSRSQHGRTVGQRPVSMLVTSSSTPASTLARASSSRPSTPVGSAALHRSTSSISSLGSVGSPSSYARPTRSSRAKAGSTDFGISASLPRSPTLQPPPRPALARSATTSAATRRPRQGRELGVSGTARRPLSMTRAPSPDQSEGYASMEQVRPGAAQNRFDAAQLLSNSGYSETRIVTPIAARVTKLEPSSLADDALRPKVIKRKPSLITLGFSGILGAVWPGSPPKAVAGPTVEAHARRPSMDRSLSNELRSSSEEDSLAALDMTLDVDPDTDTLALDKASRAHDWVAHTMPNPAPVVEPAPVHPRETSDSSARSTGSKRAPHCPAAKATATVGRNTRLSIQPPAEAANDDAPQRLAKALRHVASESRLRAEDATARLPGPKLLHRAASTLTIRPAVPVLSTPPPAPPIPAHALPLDLPPSPAHSARVIKRPSPKRIPGTRPPGAHTIDFGHGAPHRPRYDGFVLVRRFDEPGPATFVDTLAEDDGDASENASGSVGRATSPAFAAATSPAQTTLRGLLGRKTLPFDTGIVPPKGLEPGSVGQRRALAARAQA